MAIQWAGLGPELLLRLDRQAEETLGSQLQRELRTPICLDESIHTPEDARKALDLGSCRVINIKAGRVGGHRRSCEIERLCRACGLTITPPRRGSHYKVRDPQSGTTLTSMTLRTRCVAATAGPGTIRHPLIR